MSYEGKMLKEYFMPSRQEVENALLKSLLKHNGVIKEFNSDESIVNEIANRFHLSELQKSAQLETIYRKENRVKRVSLWNRLLFRAADVLVRDGFVSRPSQTEKLTGKKEWMLTEMGYDKALAISNISPSKKEFLPVKSYEVQKVVNKLKELARPISYNPLDDKKKVKTILKEVTVRYRGFRIAVIEAYDYKCAVCELKIHSPDFSVWEVEAAHIVPHSSKGKDDIWNGIALCHFHHWAFDVGWFTLTDNYIIQTLSKLSTINADFGRSGGYDLLRTSIKNKSKIILPQQKEIYPHQAALQWHRVNVFNKIESK